jgi:CelD/BcsL family acetyltransferase involved in cellulose biosynthesis
MEWDVLRLEARDRNLLCDIRTTDQAYLIMLSEGSRGCFQRLPRKLRNSLRRSERELTRFGPISLRSSDRWETVRDWFNLHCQLSVRAFQRRNQESAFEDDQYRMFVRDFLERACRNHYIDANVLTVGERVIAMHFGYAIRDHLNYVFTTFDSDFAPWGPGHLLIHRLVQLAEQRRNPLIDLFTGEQLYKRQWSNRKEPVLCVELWRDTLRGRLTRWGVQRLSTSQLVRQAERAIRRSPSLLRWGRRTKRLVQHVAQSRKRTRIPDDENLASP